jgi:hypothetical protein
MYITCIMSTIFLINFILINTDYICNHNCLINLPVMGTGNYYYYTYFYYEE